MNIEYFMQLLTPAIFHKLRQKWALQKKISWELDLDTEVVAVSSKKLSNYVKYAVLCHWKQTLWPGHWQLLK